MKIRLSEGNGGREMNLLIKEIVSRFGLKDKGWRNKDDDSATFKLKEGFLFFTTDSYTVSPLFFKGGNIGDLAFNGTVNDILVQGGKPLGVSLSLIIEEGFSKEKLFKIMESIGKASERIKVPVVTGDTKVVEKGKVDGIFITSSGIGISEKVIDEDLEEGDVVIVSGGLGEHGAVILAERYGFETDLESDTKALYGEMEGIKDIVKYSKDVTRGGLASSLNEIAKKCGKGIMVFEYKIPFKKEVKGIGDILGIDVFSLASEGRLVCVASKEKSEKVLNHLRKYNKYASVIGEISGEVDERDVVIQTKYGKRLLPEPSGNLVPRIC